MWRNCGNDDGRSGVGDFEMEFEDPGPRQDVASGSEVRRRLWRMGRGL
jgi:hypothetical protein